MDLFDRAAQADRAERAPLAERMRPRTLDELVGQEHLAGPGHLLRTAMGVYAVPGLAAGWVASAADPGLRSSIEASFTTLHQFAGVGIGEAIGQSLTAFWLIGVAVGQRRNPRFGRGPATLGVIGGIVLLLGLVEGLATVMAFDPGAFGLAAVLGFLLLTVWMIWTGLLCILRPATGA
jgi:hypothetical protein